MPDQTPFSIEVRHPAPATTLLVLAGDLDFRTRDQFSGTALALLGQGGRRLEVDLSALTFFDSAGLASLVLLHGKAEAKGMTMHVVGISPYMRYILRRTGLETVLNLPPDSGAGDRREPRR
jgi:anti-sigma B factor antagonist